MDDDRPHLTTERYVRLLLDALQGDDRRKDLRRVYRFYIVHNIPGDTQRTTSYWMLVEAVRQYSAILPPRSVKVLKGCKSLR